MMDHTVDTLQAVFAYMDDSRVGSPDRQTQIIHLEAFFSALAANGLAINLEKCVFAVPTLEILGHMISVGGSASTAELTATIHSRPSPQNIKQLHIFLGMVNFYSHFSSWLRPHFAAFDWSPEGQPKNAAVDRRGRGGFTRYKAPAHKRCHISTLPLRPSFL
jgi:hypothetical protein